MKIHPDTSNVLNALFGGYEGDLPFFLNEQVVLSSDPDLIAKHHGALRVLPANKDGISFFFAAQEETEKDSWKGCHVLPTVVQWKDGVSLYCWALENPVPVGPEAHALMDFFGMGSSDEPIPLPGTDGWELVHADSDISYEIAKLEAAYLSVSEADGAEQVSGKGMYRDAKIITPYNEDDYEGRTITITLGGNQYSKDWKPHTIPVAGLVHQLTAHEIGKKDGKAIVFADMVRGRRQKKTAKSCTAIGLDIDTGTSSAVVDNAIAKEGCLAIRYTTHSHNKRSSEINKTAILRMFPDVTEVTTEMVQEYLRSKAWDEAIVKSIKYIEDDHTDNGIVCRIAHDPMPKHRVIFPLETPFDIAKEGRTQQEAWTKWNRVIEAFANKLGVVFDRSCTDPSRLFYLPRHGKDKPFEISLFGGPMFNYHSLNLTNIFERIEQEFSKNTSKSKTLEGKSLGKWWMKYSHGFQIMDVIEDYAPDKVRSKANNGYNIECPFDEGHSNAGDSSDQACFAVNAADGGNEFIVIKCQHESCKDYTGLDMLGKMLKDVWFPNPILENPNYNIAIIEEDEGEEKTADGNSGTKTVEQEIDSLSKPLSSDQAKKIIKALAKVKDPTVILTCIGKLKAKWPGSSIKEIGSLLRAERGSKHEAEPNACFDGLGRQIFRYSDGLDVIEVRDAITAQMNRWNEPDPAVGRLGRKPRYSSLLDEITVLREHSDGPIFSQPKERPFWASISDIFLTQKVTEEGPKDRHNVSKDLGAVVFHHAWKTLRQRRNWCALRFSPPAAIFSLSPDGMILTRV